MAKGALLVVTALEGEPWDHVSLVALNEFTQRRRPLHIPVDSGISTELVAELVVEFANGGRIVVTDVMDTPGRIIC